MRALVFDYDGLIIDSETPEFECWRRVYGDHGVDLKVEDWVHVVGGVGVTDFSLELERRLGRKLDWPSIHEGRVAHHQELMRGKGALPGVEALMRLALSRGWKVGVASSSSAAWVEGGLERLGLRGLVATVRSRDRVTKLKPHPEPYLLALQDLGAEAALSIALEDSRTGVASAKAAGLRVVAVPNELTRLHDLSAADEIVDSLEQFLLPE